MSDIKTVADEIQRAFIEYKTANDERLKAIEKGRGTADLQETVAKIDAKLNELADVKSRLESAELALARRSTAPVASADDGAIRKWADGAARRRGSVPPPTFGAAELASYKDAFRGYMRLGDIVPPDVQKALSVGSDPDGGYLVSPDTSGRIVQRVYETSPMRAVASVQSISTDALEGLYDLDETAANWAGELDSFAETTTPKLGRWRIPVHEIRASPAATQKVLDDAEVNLEAWLATKVADKFSRAENLAFVSGDGNGKPRGFLTYPAGTSLPGTIERVKSLANGGFKTDGTGADPLIAMVYALKQTYRTGARFAMPRAVMSQVRQIKSEGIYLWQPGISAGQPSTLLGYPVIEMEDMPALDTGSLSLAFGNFGEAYQIVDRAGTRVLRDPYKVPGMVYFHSFRRTGGDVLNFEAIKIMQFSQS
jgi:HK97 family phage major capsid protein